MTLRRLAVVTIALLMLMIGLGGCAGLSDRGGNVPPQTPASAGETLTNTLRWTTASEIDNFGFDVYRGDTADGPFERLTDQPVAGAGTADVPTDYAYVDETIDPTREYFYYVESISMNGERVRFTPIMRAPAKR